MRRIAGLSKKLQTKKPAAKVRKAPARSTAKLAASGPAPKAGPAPVGEATKLPEFQYAYQALAAHFPGYRMRDIVAAVPDRHISFEVFSDDIPEMVAQARAIAPQLAKRLGNNVIVENKSGAAGTDLGTSPGQSVPDGGVVRLVADGDETWPQRARLLDPKRVDPDLAELTPAPGDVIVLCSDGLTTHVQDPEIAALVARSYREGVELTALSAMVGDSLKVAGKRVGPAEVESAAVRHPAVLEADLQTFQLIGVISS